MERPLKIAIIVPDNRDEFRRYAEPQPFFGPAPAALLDGLARLPECEIHIVCCVKQPLAMPEKIGPNIFFHAEVVPRLGWLRTGYLGCIRSVRRQLKKIQPDIVHGQGTERYCALAAVFSGHPNVLTIHGNMRLVVKITGAAPFSFNWFAARLESFTLPRTDGVVCITHYTREAVKPLARRTWLLPNAVDEEFFQLQTQPEPGTPPVILCVGNICIRKNQNDLIRSLDGLAAERKFKVIFLGQDDPGPYCQEFFSLLATRPWCEYVAYAGRDKVKEYFSRATLTILPTREDNCPMVVLEAMAAGVPVIASRVGGVPDLITSEVTGLFCDPLRPETFASSINRLLAEPDFARKLAHAARVEAARFHPLVIARRHLEIYRQVLAR